MAEVHYYYTSVTGNLETKKNQQKIEMILDAKKIEYQKFDVAADEAAKQRMRDISGNPKALPPQLCNGNQYCGDFDAFDEALESDQLYEFLKLR